MLKNEEMALILIKRQFYFSLFFIAQRAVKLWSIDNCPEKLNCGKVNTNLIDLMHFIDFLE